MRVNAIPPGIVEGERTQSVFENKARARGVSADVVKSEYLSYVSLKMMMTPQQIADAVIFLCSPRGRRPYMALSVTVLRRTIMALLE